ncbi:hypothetical protein BCV72DRAFT_196786, partial [Rhizopus microsporus var. microsporus]
AVAIVQQVLTPGAVVFSFPHQLFKSQHEAYRVIRYQIEDIYQYHNIDGTKHISHYNKQPNADLFIEALSVHATHRQVALSDGVCIDSINYHTPASDRNYVLSLTRVQLDFLHIPTGGSLVTGLQTSLHYYGGCTLHARENPREVNATDTIFDVANETFQCATSR